MHVLTCLHTFVSLTLSVK